MDKVKKALTRKLGPLPAWAWALIAGIGVWYYRQRMGAAASSQDQQQAGADLGYYGPYGQSPAPIDGGAGSGGATPSDVGGGGPAPPTINYTVKPGRHKRTKKRKHRPTTQRHSHNPKHKGRSRSESHTHATGAHQRPTRGQRRTSRRIARARRMGRGW